MNSDIEDVICGIETEHPATLPHDKSLSSEENGERLVACAKAVVAAFPPFSNEEWSYRYPFELYDFEGTINRVLPNGGRLYNEICFIETCTPECRTPFDAVVAERSQLQWLEDLVQKQRKIPGFHELEVWKSNVEYGVDLPFSSSNACHESYSISPRLFKTLTSPSKASCSHWIPYLVIRTLLVGAGCAFARLPIELRRGNFNSSVELQSAKRLGHEFPPDAINFQLSQRADFFSTLFDLETMKFRPLVNLRDEPHADPSAFRRLHVITGDSNRCDVATFLKVGISQLILQMLEADFLTDDFELADPLAAFRVVSRDLTLSQPLRLRRGGNQTALELLKRFYLHAKLFQRYRKNSLPEHTVVVIELWGKLLDCLSRRDFNSLSGSLDWVSKLRVAHEVSLQVNEPFGECAMNIDAQYSRIGSELFATFPKNPLFETCKTEVPPRTRAALRLWMLRNWKVKKLTWDYVELETGETYVFPDPGKPLAIDETGAEIDFSDQIVETSELESV